MKEASPNSRSHAQALSSKVYGRAAPIARSFIRSPGGGRASPLARVLRGGRGGEVRFKLLLSLIWVAAKEPHDTQFPSRAWAELLDLERPEYHGVRRVQDALLWLHEHGYIRLEAMPGHPSKVYLLDESATGAEYEHPGTRPNQAYVKLPSGFWTNGWVVTLSGIGAGLLLVLLDLSLFAVGEPVWITPAIARDVYSLSEDSWTKGTRELEERELVLVERAPVNQELFGFKRVRKVYRVNMKRLQAVPG